MKYFSTSLLRHARRGALLLALGVAGPAAWGQRFGPASFYSTGAGSYPYHLTVGDVNGDGLLDIITANAGSHSVGVLRGQPGGSFALANAYNTQTGAGSTPSNVALGDINRDGQLDIVLNDYTASTIGVMLGQGNMSFAPISVYPSGPGSRPSSVALGDVNSDGMLDVVASDNGTGNVLVFLAQRSGSFAGAVPYSTGTNSQPKHAVLGDTNGDGRLDIIVSDDSAASRVEVLLGQAGGFAAAVSYSAGVGSSPRYIVSSNVNGDNLPDIVIANSNSHSITVLLGVIGGGFAPAVTYSSGLYTYPVGLAVGDVNGDGRPDIVVANGLANTVGILLGQANGFTPATTFYSLGLNSSPFAVALNDVNGDGRLDIITANNEGFSVGVLLNTGTYTPLAAARPAAADLALAPNPTHDGFTVQLPATFSPTSAELLNALGQVVRRPAVGTASFRVETNGLAPGVYTLRLRAGGTALARRVVVE